MVADPWTTLPAELRALPQWVLAGADKVPLTAADDGFALRVASPTRPGDWMPFETAVALAWHHRDLVTTSTSAANVVTTRTGLDLGFVLCETDPFSCIDLDVKDAETHPGQPTTWTTADDFQRYVSIINTMASYTERSRSGKGVHVWVQGDIGRGFRRDGVEVYSRERYIIMTGDVYVDESVADRRELLQNMVARMRPLVDPDKAPLDELPPEVDDWYVFATAAWAANADKFWRLHLGDWQGFPSQSEADLALMSMYTFYSDSNAQCRALFRTSVLGRRDKATKDDRHLDYMLRVLRTRQARERSAELGGLIAHADAVAAVRAAVAQAQGGVVATSSAMGEVHREVQQLAEPGQGDPVQPPPPPAVALAQLAPVPPSVVTAGEDGLPWPPGFVGTLAQFVYENSYLPIKEVSVVAALGLMAGLCGKAWHIPQSGLNLYIILVARSAIGKEAMHSGLAVLVSHCSKKSPFFSNFVDFTEYVSGPALVKACLQQPSFVNVSGEWGRRLKRLAAEDGRDGPLNTLRTQMTNLYQKSGPQSIAGGLGYSNAEGSVASVAGVAYSMVGESTPGTFYEALTQSMMEDGFLSRFLVVGYDGDRPAKSPVMLEAPDDALRDALCDIAAQATEMIGRQSSHPVGRTEEAAQVMADFDAEAHDSITATDDESRRQMWNRATLKVLRVAALLAVGDHYLSPCITKTHMEWAITLIRRDIAMMAKRLEQGDVGITDNARERKLVAIIRDFLVTDKLPKSYKVSDKMHSDGLIPRKYLQVRTQAVAAFSSHKFGSARALDETLMHCVNNGWIMECRQASVISEYGHHGKTYRVLDLPDYNVAER